MIKYKISSLNYEDFRIIVFFSQVNLKKFIFFDFYFFQSIILILKYMN